MNFLYPWAVGIGIAAAAAPLVIHLLTRPRPVRLPLSTLRFVREAVRQQRARHRLRDLLILALRTAAVLLLALAVAQPRFGRQPLISEAESGQAVRVVLVDLSQSMGAREHGIERFERARTIAARFLRYRPGLRANLVLGAAAPRALFEQPSTNFDALRAELADLGVLPERIDVVAALEEAARLLGPRAPGDRARRELVVVSDFQRANWGKADFTALPEGTNIQLESVAAAAPPGNLAILRAAARPAGAQGGSVQIEVDVANYSSAMHKAAVEVVLGQAVWRGETVLGPGALTTLSDQLDLRAAGWQSGRAMLVGVDDALPADNARAMVVHIPGRPVYLLITRQRPNQRPASSHYLECALVPDARRREDASALLQRVDPSQLDATVLAPADVILLDHPGMLSEESIKLLADLLRRGRPIVYVAAEPVDATNLKRLADVAGSGLQMPVEFVPPRPGTVRRDLFLTAVVRNHPVFAVFGDQLDALTGRLRFAGGLPSQRRDQGLADDVLATYNDGSACLVVTASDAGTLAVINADLGTSNLAKSPAFVPLLDELLGQMRRGRAARRSAFCGEPLVAQLPSGTAAAAELRVVAADQAEPAGARSFGRLVDEPSGVVWRWPAPARPGVYQVRSGQQVVYAAAIGVPPEESWLDSLQAEVLTEQLAAGQPVYFAGAPDRSSERHDAWKWLAAACAVCLLCEMTALYGFRT